MYSPLLAAVLLVLFGHTLVSRSQTLFLWIVQSAGKRAGYARPPRPLFRTGRYRFQYGIWQHEADAFELDHVIAYKQSLKFNS